MSPVCSRACLKLALLGLWLPLPRAEVRGLAATPALPQRISIQEAKRRLAAAPDSRPRCVLRGVVTLSQGTLPSMPGVFYFQDETSGISVSSPEVVPLNLGDQVEVEGRLHLIEDGEPEIQAARTTRLGRGPQVLPRRVTLEDALSPRYAGQLIRVSERVLQIRVGQTRDVLHLGPRPPGMRAYTRRRLEQASVLPQVAPVGALVEVTGISLPWSERKHQIRMRSSTDLMQVEPPPRFTKAQLFVGAAALALLVLVAVTWILTLRRAVRRQTAEIRKLLDRAQETSRLKSEFLANVSHEIRTPLHGILGMSGLTLQSDLSPEQREQLDAVHSSAESLLRIVNDLLDLSKIEAGKLELHPAPFRLRETLEDSLKCVGIQAARKRLRLSCQVPPDVPDHWVGDRDRLHQVLVNLLGNAVKFTERGAVEASVHLASPQNGKAALHFCVSDTGIGIPPDKQAYIFEAFAQADGSATRRHGGTGLGLAICSQLVRAMGGNIWVDSQPGHGSTFHFQVVLPEAAPVPASPAPGPNGSGRQSDATPLRILVAEDNLVNQRLAQRLLERRGHAVTLVANGREALRELERHTFDLLLLDLQMPELDGLATAAAVREKERDLGGAHLPIVALTASALRGDRECCLAAGMDAYLAKPLKAAELEALLERFSTPGARTDT